MIKALERPCARCCHPLLHASAQVALLKEEFIDDVKNPVVSYERNFITGELAITLWPPGMYEKAHSVCLTYATPIPRYTTAGGIRGLQKGDKAGTPCMLRR